MDDVDPRPELPLDPGYELCFECGGGGICPWCDGTGRMPDEPSEPCFMCGGRLKCAMCAGTGQLPEGTAAARGRS